MKIKFLKSHPAGIAEGTVREVSAKFAKRMLTEKFAKETDEEITASPKKEKGAPGASLQKVAEKVIKTEKTEKPIVKK